MANPSKSKTISIARSILGVREYPNGSNRTWIGKWFGWNGKPWCAMTVSYILIKAGFKVRKNAGAWALGRQLAGTKGWRKVSARSIQGGDVVVYKHSHIGFCEAARSDGRKVCIEGNYGNKVARVVRSVSSISYGVRPPYGSSSYTPAPKPSSSSTPTLRQGSSGSAVKTAQKLLGIAVDGEFGPKTAAAVRAFQKRNGLTVDGVIGPNTWRKLKASKPAPSPAKPKPAPKKPTKKRSMPLLKRGARGADVKTLQAALNKKLGGANITVDGDFGPKTEYQVKRFQRKIGIKVDGVVGPVTWAKLGY